MGAAVKFEAVIDAIDLPDEWESFIDPETGEIVTISEDDRCVLDEEDDDEDIETPEWQPESIAKIRKVLESGRAIALPGKFDIHEGDLMQRFSLSVEDPDERTALLNAIHGTGAFRLFRETTDRLGLRDRWFEYRSEALREIAREWLEANGIEYVREGGGG